MGDRDVLNRLERLAPLAVHALPYFLREMLAPSFLAARTLTGDACDQFAKMDALTAADGRRGRLDGLARSELDQDGIVGGGRRGKVGVPVGLAEWAGMVRVRWSSNVNNAVSGQKVATNRAMIAR